VLRSYRQRRVNNFNHSRFLYGGGRPRNDPRNKSPRRITTWGWRLDFRVLVQVPTKISDFLKWRSLKSLRKKYKRQ